ncbi:hypothetical protein L6452_22507 [Arctium lappa]|uniref:Uncharacterized protein n=1 Tax=Arctium lappa TaxID=4217 RepID=A0ACB9AZ49_ARCLA|nr:hypothetical protein L6452_22507 [Arctium lappa]
MEGSNGGEDAEAMALGGMEVGEEAKAVVPEKGLSAGNRGSRNEAHDLARRRSHTEYPVLLSGTPTTHAMTLDFGHGLVKAAGRL